jgi:hypothetical protein
VVLALSCFVDGCADVSSTVSCDRIAVRDDHLLDRQGGEFGEGGEKQCAVSFVDENVQKKP